MKALRKTLIFFAFNLLAVTLLLSAVEMTLYLRDFGRYSKHESPTRGYYWEILTSDGLPLGRRKGGFKLMLHPLLVYKSFPDQKTPIWSINHLGLRGNEIGEKSAFQKRIIIVGGSAAMGARLNHDEQTLSAQLENILGVEVLNAGVLGYQSSQELVYLVTELVDLKPDLVIALDGWNDYSDIGLIKKRHLVGTNGFMGVENKLRAMHLVTDASLLAKIKNIDRILFPRLSDALRGSSVFTNLFHFKRKTGQNRPLDLDTAANVYSENIIKMSRIGEAFQFKFLCVLQGEKTDPYLKKRNRLYRSFRAVVKKRFEENKLAYLDLNDKEYRVVLTSDEFIDWVHMSAEGNRLAAEILAKKIRELELLK